LSLLKSPPARRTPGEAGAQVKSSRSETLPFKQALELLEGSLPFGQAVVITTLPRGSLQIAQPGRLPEGMLKAYSRDFHVDDRLTWQAILGQTPVTASDVFRNDDRFVVEYLKSIGQVHAAAAPLAAPVLEGYPGALHVYRAADAGPFSADELSRLGDLARQIDELVEQARRARRETHHTASITLTPRPRGRVFVFDAQGEQKVTIGGFEQFDQRLRDSLAEEASVRLGRLDGEPFTADRVQVADSRGDLWVFRAATYSRYPALGDGPFVIFSLQPSCAEWAVVRPTDFQADPEIARLVPALRFMSQEFHRGPGLGEIARTVHLSPFHFHRRFAELLGLTPKHYLLECQINQAKAELLAKKKELAQIATDCGFAHQSHFTSRFKQATGLTPTRWRRLAGDVARSL
jgi:AraC-like DNA-binding protein